MRRLSILVEGLAFVAALGLFIAQGLDSVLGLALIALASVLVLSAFLNLFRITQEGYGNTYYAATVKNMLASWSNFFFVSYDAGFVSVDKPPLGLWICPAERVGGLDRGELRKGATRAVAIGPRRRRSTNSEG